MRGVDEFLEVGDDKGKGSRKVMGNSGKEREVIVIEGVYMLEMGVLIGE